jgi:hypothetical protein
MTTTPATILTGDAPPPVIMAHMPGAEAHAQHLGQTLDAIVRRFMRPGDTIQQEIAIRQAYACGARSSQLTNDAAVEALQHYLALDPVPTEDIEIARWLTRQAIARQVFCIGIEAGRAWVPDAMVYAPGEYTVEVVGEGTRINQGHV